MADPQAPPPASPDDFAGSGKASLFQQALCWTLILSSVAAVLFAEYHWTHYRLRAGVPWMLGGILLAAVAGSFSPLRGSLLAPPGGGRLRTAEKWFLVALVVAGGLVRFLSLDRFPPGGFFDEVQNLLVAEGILAGERPIFIGGATQLPALVFYLLAAAVQIAGKSVATVRGLSALFGTLTLPAFYFLARRMFAWPAAAAAALFLAGSRWHITFSRVGFTTIIGPLLEVVAVLCLWKGMESGKRRHYLLFGLVVGIGLQTYYSFNFFPAVLLVAVVSYAGRRGWRSFGRELAPIAKGLVWSVLLAAVLLLPLARFVFREREAFLQRSNAVAIWNPVHNRQWPGVLWDNTAAHLLMFHHLGDANPRHNIPEVPLFDPLSGVLLSVGVGLALRRALQWPQATVFGWLSIMLLPAILTIEAPQAHRAVGAIPAVYLLVGQALNGGYALVRGRGARMRGVLAALLCFGLALAAARENVSRYFRVQVRTPLAWQAFEAEYHEMARLIASHRDRYGIWVSPLYYDYPILRFHLGPDFPYHRFLVGSHLPLSRWRSSTGTEGAFYLLEPFQKGLFPLFREVYPDARLQEHRDPFGRTMFVSIVVPRRNLESPSDPSIGQRGFLGAYYPNERWEGRPSVVRRDPAVFFHFHWEGEALNDPFTADWTSVLRIEEEGEYVFDLTTTGATTVFIDDRVIAAPTLLNDPHPVRAVARLSKGDHVLAVRYLKKGYASTISVSWRPPSGVQSVIPLRLLRPFGREEYERLRPRLSRPGAP
jgi:hypothetical protein